MKEFDPTLLERGAAALREIDESKHAKEALDLVKVQEKSKQLELKRDIEKATIEQKRVEGEEQRKTLELETEHYKYRAQLSEQLAAKRESENREEQRKLNAEYLRAQDELNRRQEQERLRNEMAIQEERRRTQREQADLERDNIRVRALAEAEGEIRRERANKDLHMDRIKLEAEERRKTLETSIGSFSKSVGRGFTSLVTDRERLWGTIGLATGLALAVYSARVGTSVMGNFVAARLGQPNLVKETSRFSFKNWRSLFSGSKDVMEGIVLRPELDSRLRDIAVAARNTSKNKAPYKHLLLHGPPGTGKTMFARQLAQYSGLNYAITTGGDVSPLGSRAPHEIHKLFDWAESSRSKGLLLFIDEADAFLRRGRDADGIMSENLRNALNAFLHRTGGHSKHVMIALATNHPEVLDDSVQDRIDDMVSFANPGPDERRKLFLLYLDKFILSHRTGFFITRTLKCNDDALDDAQLDHIVEQTADFSAREIAKLVIGLQSAVFGTDDLTLTRKMMLDVLQQKLDQRKWTQQLSE